MWIKRGGKVEPGWGRWSSWGIKWIDDFFWKNYINNYMI